jgi:hypothetical protein
MLSRMKPLFSITVNAGILFFFTGIIVVLFESSEFSSDDLDLSTDCGTRRERNKVRM